MLVGVLVGGTSIIQCWLVCVVLVRRVLGVFLVGGWRVLCGWVGVGHVVGF